MKIQLNSTFTGTANIPAPPTRPKSSTPHSRARRVREPIASKDTEPVKSSRKGYPLDPLIGKSRKTITRENMQKRAKEKKESTTPRDTDETPKENGSVTTTEENNRDSGKVSDENQETSATPDERKTGYSSIRRNSDSSSSLFSTRSSSRSSSRMSDVDGSPSKAERKSSVSSTGSHKQEVSLDRKDLDRSDQFNNNFDSFDDVVNEPDGLKTSRKDRPLSEDRDDGDNNRDKDQMGDEHDKHDSKASTSQMELSETAKVSQERRASVSSTVSTSSTEHSVSNYGVNVVTKADIHKKPITSSNNDDVTTKENTALEADTGKPKILVHSSSSDHGSEKDANTTEEFLKVEDEQLEKISVNSETLRTPALYDKKYQSEDDSFLSVMSDKQEVVSINSDILRNPAHYDKKYQSPRDDTRDSHLLGVDTDGQDAVSVNSEVLQVPASYHAKYQSKEDNQDDSQAHRSFNDDTKVDAGRMDVDAVEERKELDQNVNEDKPEKRKELPEDGKLVFYFTNEKGDTVDKEVWLNMCCHFYLHIRICV